MKTAIASVCSLSGEELRERAQRWTEVRERALEAATQSEAGARFEYFSSPQVEAELRDLVAAERKCCAVDGIQWDLESSKDTLVVRVTIPESLRESPEVKLIFGVIGGR
jgi:hypothetical protein